MFIAQSTPQLVSLSEILSVILSFVALVVTIVGFFASLKFYRDGVTLQRSANDALTKLEEKTQFIQTQVGGMFERTLDAAIGKRQLLSENFQELQAGLEQTKTRIVEESVAEIGAAGEQERKRIAAVVERQIEGLRQKVQNTKESAEAIAQASGYGGYGGYNLHGTHSGPPEWHILRAFSGFKGEALSLDEIAKRTGIALFAARDAVNSLQSREVVDSLVDSQSGETLYKLK